MRVAATAVFAVAVIAVSAGAAPLGVEPIASAASTTTAPVDTIVSSSSPNESTSNSTSDHKIGIQAGRWCKGMLNANWNDYKYACTWSHGSWGVYYNQFFMKWNGDVSQQCNCDKGLDQYDALDIPGSGWIRTYEDHVTCVTQDWKDVSVVKHEFDNYSCSR